MTSLPAIVSVGVLAATFIGCSQAPPSAEEKRTRGESLLRAMSDTLGQAQAFSFETTETHERVRRNGQKADVSFTREVKVRRPNGLWIHQKGSEREFTVQYDGKMITVVGDAHKIFARAPMPATIDAMLDTLADRYDVPLPFADVLSASAHDSFIGPDTTGGWVQRETLEGKSCDRVAYEHKAVAFTLWIAAEAPAVPCRLEITYKDRPGTPASRLSFRNWNLQAHIEDAQFAAHIPQGYEEIPIVERVTKKQLTDEIATPAAGTATK